MEQLSGGKGLFSSRHVSALTERVVRQESLGKKWVRLEAMARMSSAAILCRSISNSSNRVLFDNFVETKEA